MENRSTTNKAVSCKWTVTLFFAFCFMLFAQDSKSTDSPKVNSEMNAEMTSERVIRDTEEGAFKLR